VGVEALLPPSDEDFDADDDVELVEVEELSEPPDLRESVL